MTLRARLQRSFSVMNVRRTFSLWQNFFYQFSHFFGGRDRKLPLVIRQNTSRNISLFFKISNSSRNGAFVKTKLSCKLLLRAAVHSADSHYKGNMAWHQLLGNYSAVPVYSVRTADIIQHFHKFRHWCTSQKNSCIRNSFVCNYYISIFGNCQYYY